MRKVWLVAVLLAVGCAAVLVCLTLTPLLTLLSSTLLDSTPRTGLSTLDLTTSLRTTLPPESIGLLVLSAFAAVMGFAADRLF